MNRFRDSNLNIICLESDAFYALIDEVVDHITDKHNSVPDKWIDDTQAMKLLGVRSKTTLQSYRDNGKIRFTQPSKKVILYDRESILNFLETKAKDTF